MTGPGIELTEMAANRVLLLNNRNCPYCGCSLEGDVESDKEHVIGRRFVPRGTLDAAWNLLVRSCRPCNAKKAELEDDISAITMHPDSAGRFACDDERLHTEARRKAKGAISRKTKKAVIDSQAKMQIKGVMGPLTMTFDMVAPPQADEDRLFALARSQLAGFFFYLTYKEELERGHFWLGDFYPLMAAPKGDWGNPRLRWFEEVTADWDTRWHAITADGFYKSWIRRQDEETVLWAWALEWNCNYRLVGFFGEREPMARLNENIPSLQWDTLSEWQEGYLKMRTDAPLLDEEDRLFERPVAAVAEPALQPAASAAPSLKVDDQEYSSALAHGPIELQPHVVGTSDGGRFHPSLGNARRALRRGSPGQRRRARGLRSGRGGVRRGPRASLRGGPGRRDRHRG